MRNLRKLIAVTLIAALLVCTLLTGAFADEKIYTSPAFKLPADRLNNWLGQQEEEEPEVAPEGEPEAEPEAEAETEPEAEAETEPEAEAETEPEAEAETEPEAEPEADPEAESGEVPEGDAPVIEETEDDQFEGEGEEEGLGDEDFDGEDDEDWDEDDEDWDEDDEDWDDEDDEDWDAEAADESGDDASEVDDDSFLETRAVRIYSSQGDVVTEGEIIKLSSKLMGFDGLQITYQWQVDKNDGNGWMDVEGATRDSYVFVADKETVLYSWRLIVNVVE